MRNTKFLLTGLIIIFCLPNLTKAAELIVNGGFENNIAFLGWTRVNSPNPWRLWFNGSAGNGGGFNSVAPTSVVEGTRNAWHGMTDNSTNNSSWQLYQDVTIPAGNGVTITWKDRYQVNHIEFCPGGTCQPKHYYVEIVNPTTSAVISELYHWQTIGNVNQDTGWLTHTYSLVGQGGQTVRLRFRGTETVALSGPGQIEIDAVSMNSFTTMTTKRRADFDGDGRTDVSVFRPSNSTWYLQRSTQGYALSSFGISSDTLIPFDFDGDNKADIAVFRPTSVVGVPDFYILRSSNNTLQGAEWGTIGDLAVPADYDGDGKDDYAIWRGSTGDFFVLLQTGTTRHYRFGINGDKPVVADYDGDGKADFAVFRPSNGTWYYARSIDNAVVFSQWGLSTDKLVPADYDGDNKTDFAVWRPSDGTWYIQKSSGGNAYIPFGLNGDVPVPGEYDGDGKVDPAVFRGNNWYALQSTNGFMAIPFGLSSDVPTPSAFVY